MKKEIIKLLEQYDLAANQSGVKALREILADAFMKDRPYFAKALEERPDENGVYLCLVKINEDIVELSLYYEIERGWWRRDHIRDVNHIEEENIQWLRYGD